MAHALPCSATHRSLPHSRSVKDIIYPCPNLSVFYLLRYHWLNGNTKSLADRDFLVDEAILQPDFNPQDLVGVNLRDIDNRLAEAARNWDPNCPPAEGWKNIPLLLEVPRLRSQLDQEPFHLQISGLRARTLLDIMHKAFSSNNHSTFHYEPFYEYYKPPSAPESTPQPLFGEMYTSTAMNRAHREVQTLQISDPNCTLPRCVAAFMFSDKMKMADTICPVFASAHIPTLPDSVKDDISRLYDGKPPNEALLTHLRRELMHAVWSALIDEAFVDAWQNGVIIDCADGIRRRVFPRIMTYSADYPEKVLLATIRNGGNCLCPRCLVQKSVTSQVGTTQDMNIRKHKRRKDNNKYRNKVNDARDLIYEQGCPIQSKAVEDLLRIYSNKICQNAFSRLGGELGFNIFSALVVDQLHEVELGVWKALFKHLIRLVHLGGNRMITEFNIRFRSVPPFGSTIRMFAEDVSSMGRIAARDFEDILQCCIPVFDGLLPDICDKPAQKLLFLFAKWHGLAKLRLHSKSTLAIFKSLTAELAVALREFAELTKSLDVRETPQEYARRKKREEAAKATTMARRGQTATSTRNQEADTSDRTNAKSGDGRRECSLNLNTYKAHSFGDYARTIEEYGTTDSYSTQIGELQGRRFKAQYLRTNKNGAVEQMTRVDDITSILREMEGALAALDEPSVNQPPIDEEAIKSLLEGQAFSIGLKDRSEDLVPNVALWVSQHSHDISTKFFLPQLKRHLLARVLGSHSHPEYHDGNLFRIRLAQERMYRHNTLRVNYTTYDVLRQQDSLSVTSHQCFALLPTETDRHPNDHPFIYAKILGIYHAKVIYDRRPPKRYEFVHVRWLYYDYDRPGGWEQYNLDRLSYQICRNDQDILYAFDFVDPQDIIRATHLIPDFKTGKTHDYIPRVHSIAHDHAEGTDWRAYYVNRFVDRDMLMRYVGGGVGAGRNQHTLTEAAVQSDDESDGEEGGRDQDEDENEGEGEDEEAEADNNTDARSTGPNQSKQMSANATEQEHDEAAEFDEDQGDKNWDDESEGANEDHYGLDDEVEF
ncbi:hypothetical protein RSAG8_05975, partial [Rhizoctonia solani AG-8 WAC10335]